MEERAKTLFGVKEAKRSLLQEVCQMPMPDLRHCKHTVSIQADPIVGPKKALRLSKRPNESRTLQLDISSTIFFPAIFNITGVCPSHANNDRSGIYRGIWRRRFQRFSDILPFFSFMGGKNEEGRRKGTEGVSINNICERNNTAF